jgi:microcystin-dependent protein
MARTRFTVKEGISVADDNTVGGYPLIPVGALMPYAGSTAPDGWLLCNGQTPSRTTYANLFAVLGTTYGAGDGSTFGLPDPMGRAIIGAGAGTGLTTRALAATGGAETVVIGSGNLPTHSHTLSAHTHTSAEHSHTLSAHTHTSAAHSHTLSAHTHTHATTHSHTLSAHTHALGGHTHLLNHGHTVTSEPAGNDHAHNIPRGLIATSGTNRAVVSTQDNQPAIAVGGQSASHSHAMNITQNSSNTGEPSAGSNGPSTDATNSVGPGTSDGPSVADTSSVTPAATGGPSVADTSSVTPGSTGGPSSDTTGNGGFANTALAMMNPFLALNYIIKY